MNSDSIELVNKQILSLQLQNQTILNDDLFIVNGLFVATIFSGKTILHAISATTMVVTDVEDEICWWQFWPFWSPISSISQHWRWARISDVTKILILSPTVSHQHHDVTNCGRDFPWILHWFYTYCSIGSDLERSNGCSTGFGSDWITFVLQLGAPGYFEISHCEVEFNWVHVSSLVLIWAYSLFVSNPFSIS